MKKLGLSLLVGLFLINLTMIAKAENTLDVSIQASSGAAADRLLIAADDDDDDDESSTEEIILID